MNSFSGFGPFLADEIIARAKGEGGSVEGRSRLLVSCNACQRSCANASIHRR